MWQWALEWGEVTPGLFVGTCPMQPAHVRRIGAQTHVDAIVSLQHDACLAYWHIDERALRETAGDLDIVHTRCPIRDFDVVDMRRHLPRALATLAGLRQAGRRTYLHCTAGLGRAPLVALGYLLLFEDMSVEAAAERVHAARPGAVPAWEALHGAIADMTGQHHAAVEARAYTLYEETSNTDAAANWYQAQREVLRETLLGRGNAVHGGAMGAQREILPP